MRKKCHSIGKLLSRGGRGGVKVGGEGGVCMPLLFRLSNRHCLLLTDLLNHKNCD